MKALALASYPIEAASTRYRVAQFIEPLAEQGITLTVHPFLESRLPASLCKQAEWPRTGIGLIRAVRIAHQYFDLTAIGGRGYVNVYERLEENPLR